MNADGSAGITTDVSAGAEVPVLATVIATLFVVAGLLLLLGAVLVAMPIRAATRPPAQYGIEGVWAVREHLRGR